MTQQARLARRSWGQTMALALAAALLLLSPVFGAAPPVDTERFTELPKAWLNVITDGPGPGVGSPEIYSKVLAKRTSPAAFKKAVRSDLTYAHLLNNPDDYRGQVLHVEGRLKRINRIPVPREAVREGVAELFEAWIFSESLGANPYCVVFTEWPDNLPRSLLGKDTIDGDYRAALDGYFVKKFRYQAKGNVRRVDRDAPLLIGHSLHAQRTPTPGERRLEGQTTGLLALFGWLLMPVVGLTWWFHRGDSRTRQRLPRSRDFVLPTTDALPVGQRGARSRWLPGLGRLVLLPQITDSSGSGKRAGRPSSADPGGKRRPGDQPPDEGAGAQPRP